MSTFINVIISLIIFGIIIFIHEFGHFLLAKKNGIYVQEFAIGMGPTLFTFQKKETKYSLKLIPMGGYCMMLGEEEDIDDLNSFSNKSVWARLSVVVAGPLFNFILAFFLSLVLISIVGFDEPIVSGLSNQSPAKEAGVLVGDRITHIDGHRIFSFRELLIFNQFNQSPDPITLTVERDDKQIDYKFKRSKVKDTYLMGVESNGYVKSNPLDTIKNSFLELRFQIKSTFLSLKYLFTGKVSFNQLSGPVGIVAMMNDSLEQAKESSNGNQGVAFINAVLNMLNFCIVLSAGLGIMNLLPIPALDGGRTVFLLMEGIFNKKLSTEKEAIVNTIGFIFLIGLMVIVMFQDVFKLFH